jgi:hypothetical protein
MWWTRKPTVEDSEAVEAREAAQQQLAEVKTQGRYVNRLTSALIERRAHNHFGEDLQITFKPRTTP